jgi:hypothetical protein
VRGGKGETRRKADTPPRLISSLRVLRVIVMPFLPAHGTTETGSRSVSGTSRAVSSALAVRRLIRVPEGEMARPADEVLLPRDPGNGEQWNAAGSHPHFSGRMWIGGWSRRHTGSSRPHHLLRLPENHPPAPRSRRNDRANADQPGYPGEWERKSENKDSTMKSAARARLQNRRRPRSESVAPQDRRARPARGEIPRRNREGENAGWIAAATLCRCAAAVAVDGAAGVDVLQRRDDAARDVFQVFHFQLVVIGLGTDNALGHGSSPG